MKRREFITLLGGASAEDQLDCHRAILVARVLSDNGMTIRHILADGAIEEHSHALKRLIAILRVSTSDMFRSEAVIEDAYNQKGHQIAYQDRGCVKDGWIEI